MNGIFFHHPAWPVLYEDNHLLVLYKPAGLLVQGDETGDPSLIDLGKEWIKTRYDKPGRVYLGMVHRIDRPVAGVVLFCRTSKAAGRLSEQFRNSETVKEYLAVVHGTPKRPSATLIQQMEQGDNRSSRIVSSPSPRSREARLSYETRESTEETSLLLVRLETGRRHQIRLQLSHMGCPILGDLRYGAPAPLPGKPVALLAWRLEIAHPVGGKRIRFESPIPADWPQSHHFPAEPSVPWNWSWFQNQPELARWSRL